MLTSSHMQFRRRSRRSLFGALAVALWPCCIPAVYDLGCNHASARHGRARAIQKYANDLVWARSMLASGSVCCWTAVDLKTTVIDNLRLFLLTAKDCSY